MCFRNPVSGRTLPLQKKDERAARPPMPKAKSASRDTRSQRAAKTLQRAIRKDQPAEDRPTVGKAVIVPADDARQAGKN